MTGESTYLIYTDSAADLPLHIFNEYDLRIVLMDYTLNGKNYVFDTASPDHDRICDEFFAALKTGADAKTTQVTAFKYEECFRPALEAGNDILYLCFSSRMSNMCNNAFQIAEDLMQEFPERKLLVIDTLAATMGQGVLVRAALMNRESGMGIEENAAWLEKNKKYICHRFLVGDLDYLHKGGRVSTAAAVVGSMLKIKPLLIINDEGMLTVYSKARGMKIAKKRIVEGHRKEQGVPDVPKIIHVGHTSLYEEAEEAKAMVEAICEEGTIVETVNMGPIVGAHCGPELISVCGWGFHRAEQD